MKKLLLYSVLSTLFINYTTDASFSDFKQKASNTTLNNQQDNTVVSNSLDSNNIENLKTNLVNPPDVTPSNSTDTLASNNQLSSSNSNDNNQAQIATKTDTSTDSNLTRNNSLSTFFKNTMNLVKKSTNSSANSSSINQSTTSNTKQSNSQLIWKKAISFLKNGKTSTSSTIPSDSSTTPADNETTPPNNSTSSTSTILNDSATTLVNDKANTLSRSSSSTTLSNSTETLVNSKNNIRPSRKRTDSSPTSSQTTPLWQRYDYSILTETQYQQLLELLKVFYNISSQVNPKLKQPTINQANATSLINQFEALEKQYNEQILLNKPKDIPTAERQKLYKTATEAISVFLAQQEAISQSTSNSIFNLNNIKLTVNRTTFNAYLTYLLSVEYQLLSAIAKKFKEILSIQYMTIQLNPAVIQKQPNLYSQLIETQNQIDNLLKQNNKTATVERNVQLYDLTVAAQLLASSTESLLRANLSQNNQIETYQNNLNLYSSMLTELEQYLIYNVEHSSPMQNYDFTSVTLLQYDQLLMFISNTYDLLYTKHTMLMKLNEKVMKKNQSNLISQIKSITKQVEETKLNTSSIVFNTTSSKKHRLIQQAYTLALKLQNLISSQTPLFKTISDKLLQEEQNIVKQKQQTFEAYSSTLKTIEKELITHPKPSLPSEHQGYTFTLLTQEQQDQLLSKLKKLCSMLSSRSQQINNSSLTKEERISLANKLNNVNSSVNELDSIYDKYKHPDIPTEQKKNLYKVTLDFINLFLAQKSHLSSTSNPEAIKQELRTVNDLYNQNIQKFTDIEQNLKNYLDSTQQSSSFDQWLLNNANYDNQKISQVNFQYVTIQDYRELVNISKKYYQAVSDRNNMIKEAVGTRGSSKQQNQLLRQIQLRTNDATAEYNKQVIPSDDNYYYATSTQKREIYKLAVYLHTLYQTQKSIPLDPNLLTMKNKNILQNQDNELAEFNTKLQNITNNLPQS